MRVPLATGLLLLSCACSRHLVLNNNGRWSKDDWLRRADLMFIGVIEKHQFDTWPYIRLTLRPGDDFGEPRLWKTLRREVRVETVLRGHEARKVINVYEVFWTGGTTGDWNNTHDGQRALFLVRIEDGMYHVVGDWWRSIFPVTTGPHDELPLDNSHSLWERIALMNWWVSSDASLRITYPYFRYSDPGGVLDVWRTMKLERGLVRHPSPGVRVAACRELLLMQGWGQDECWDSLSEPEREHLHDSGYVCCSKAEVARWRAEAAMHNAEWFWSRPYFSDREDRRILTAMNNRRLRIDFCRLWEHEYPDDHDSGCPADAPPPATIVNHQGDVPFVGAWPP